MPHLHDGFTPDSPAAAARVIAMLLARDGRVDPRELDYLDRHNAFTLLGITRAAFMEVLAAALGERAARRAARSLHFPFEPELAAIRSRRLQLLVAGLLVYISEIDGEVCAEESALVRSAFSAWNLSADILHREMRVPRRRSWAALGMLPEAA